MACRVLLVLPLVALFSCTRWVTVESPAAVLARADSIRLRSGEHVKVERIVEQTADSVVVESQGTVRRLAIADVQTVVDRRRGLGFAEGAITGAGVGGAIGVVAGLFIVASDCSSDEPEDDEYDFDAFVCGVAYIVVPTALGLAGALIGVVPGGLIGMGVGHKDVYRRRPPLTIAPTAGGLRAMWTIEF